MTDYTHFSVMPGETLDALDIRPDDTVVDATCGLGGHSSLILERLGDNGRLIGIDKDEAAIAHLNDKFGHDSRVTIVHGDFKDIKTILAELGVGKVDRILVDLGVSSMQLDDPDRGFAYSHDPDSPLDMRLSKEAGTTAAELVNTLPKEELARILRENGDERFASSIADRIVRLRRDHPIGTTGELAEIVRASIPAKARRTGGNPCKKTFLALRIAVNSELEILPDALEDMFDCLDPDGGRLVGISFHSGEDRILKAKIKEWCVKCTCDPRSPICTCGHIQRGVAPFSSKAPCDEELALNSRSKSARLRAVIKIND